MQETELTEIEKQLMSEDPESHKGSFFLIVITEGGEPKIYRRASRDAFLGILGQMISFCKDSQMWSRIFAFFGEEIKISSKKSFYEVEIDGDIRKIFLET